MTLELTKYYVLIKDLEYIYKHKCLFNNTQCKIHNRHVIGAFCPHRNNTKVIFGRYVYSLTLKSIMPSILLCKQYIYIYQ